MTDVIFMRRTCTNCSFESQHLCKQRHFQQANSITKPKVTKHQLCRRLLREQWIRAKYERREFVSVERQEAYSAGKDQTLLCTVTGGKKHSSYGLFRKPAAPMEHSLYAQQGNTHPLIRTAGRTADGIQYGDNGKGGLTLQFGVSVWRSRSLFSDFEKLTCSTVCSLAVASSFLLSLG